MDFVLFDLGGVLCEVEPARSEAAWNLLLPGQGSIVDRMNESLAKPYGDVGRLTARGMAAHLSDYLGVVVTEEQLKQVWGDMVCWRPFTRRLVKQLKVPFGVLSTIDPIHSERIGPLDGADPLVYSWEIGVAKPDPRAFEIALERIAVPPSRILYLDDLEENVKVATRCGMTAVQVTHEKEISAALGKLCAQS